MLVGSLASFVGRESVRKLWSRTMPAGVSWPKYLKILTATFLSMLAGAQTVHKFYKPDLTPDIPPEAGELRTEMPSLRNTNEPVQPLQPRS